MRCPRVASFLKGIKVCALAVLECLPNYRRVRSNLICTHIYKAGFNRTRAHAHVIRSNTRYRAYSLRKRGRAQKSTHTREDVRHKTHIYVRRREDPCLFCHPWRYSNRIRDFYVAILFPWILPENLADLPSGLTSRYVKLNI